MEWHSILADILVTIHLGIVGFVVVGQLLILLGFALGWEWVRSWWFRLAHLFTIGIVVFEAFCGFDCPLTTWERQLRAAVGQDVSDASFVGRFINALLFYPAPEWMFRVGHCVFGAVVFLTFVLAPPRWPSHNKALTEAV